MLTNPYADPRRAYPLADFRISLLYACEQREGAEEGGSGGGRLSLIVFYGCGHPLMFLVPWRARVYGSQTGLSLNSRIESDKLEKQKFVQRAWGGFRMPTGVPRS